MVWSQNPLMPALGKWRQKDQKLKLKAILGYIVQYFWVKRGYIRSSKREEKSICWLLFIWPAHTMWAVSYVVKAMVLRLALSTILLACSKTSQRNTVFCMEFQVRNNAKYYHFTKVMESEFEPFPPTSFIHHSFMVRIYLKCYHI